LFLGQVKTKEQKEKIKEKPGIGPKLPKSKKSKNLKARDLPKQNQIHSNSKQKVRLNRESLNKGDF
jgi:hypothetical protein